MICLNVVQRVLRVNPIIYIYSDRALHDMAWLGLSYYKQYYNLDGKYKECDSPYSFKIHSINTLCPYMHTETQTYAQITPANHRSVFAQHPLFAAAFALGGRTCRFPSFLRNLFGMSFERSLRAGFSRRGLFLERALLGAGSSRSGLFSKQALLWP